MENDQRGGQEAADTDLQRRRCQVDASWVSAEEDIGVGFLMMDGGTTMLYGAKRSARTESPLHAEAEGLIWTMQEALKRDPTIMHFETDCQQLVNLLKKDDEEWPAMATELDDINDLRSNFNTFSISYLPRSKNVRADGLAKGVRSRDLRSPYVNCCAPRWLAPVASQSEAS